MMVGITRFRRDSAHDWEWGIAISRVDNLGGEVDVIIDRNGHPIHHPIYDYKDNSYWGCFKVPRELI